VRTPRLGRLGRSLGPSEPNAGALRRSAEEAAARVPDLMVAAERIAATVIQGLHGRRRVGQGDTFWQFRQYQPGDSAQAIDWRQTAKSRGAFVRENEWEAAQSVWIWCDRSASMQFGSEGVSPDKQARAAVLALALSLLLIRGGEQVALLGSGMAPNNGRAVAMRLAKTLAGEDPTGESLPRVEPLPRYARLVLFGDMLQPIPEIEHCVRTFAAMGVDGHILQIIDPAEATLPYHGRIQFEGLEGEGSILIGRVEGIRQEYIAVMQRHRDGLSDLARSVGWTCGTHLTDAAPQSALLALHAALGNEGG